MIRNKIECEIIDSEEIRASHTKLKESSLVTADVLRTSRHSSKITTSNSRGDQCRENNFLTM